MFTVHLNCQVHLLIEEKVSTETTTVQAGLVFNAFAVDLRVNNMVLAANRVGLIALPVCREQQDPSQLCSVEISDIWLIGEPDLENCYNVNPSSEGSSCTLPEALTASPEGVCSTR